MPSSVKGIDWTMVSPILWDQSARGGVHTAASINDPDSARIPSRLFEKLVNKCV
jgi:hypothetical protein